MSEIKVDKISPRAGTDVTLGDSGDTFTIPSGATIANSGTATGFGENNSPSWMAKIAATQTLSANTWTVIQIASEQIDTDSAFDTSTYAFTVPSGKGGYYLVTGGCMFPNGNDGYHYRLRFTIGGSTCGYSTWGRHEVNSSGGSQDATFSVILNLSAGDVVKMEGYSETAGDLGAASGDEQERCFFGGFLVAGV